MKAAVFCFAVLAAASQVAAQTASERPVARPGSTSSGTVGVQVEQSGAIRQIRRGPDAEEAIDRGRNLNQSERPSARTPGVELTARQQRRLLAKGAVCEDIDIQGKVVGRVPGRIPGCGIEGAVRITSVSGIALSQPSVIDCPTAAALKTWINQSVKPALRDIGGGVQSLRVAAHYACRTRNNQPGARISEHGKGRAIDISGFNLKDGSSISVLKGWNARATAQAMRKMHRGACGPFGTVLGPESDSFHRDHFHFDTARYRSGPYCR
jgi:hypothetical protein